MGDLANGVTLVALFSLNVQFLTDDMNGDHLQGSSGDVLCTCGELGCHAILLYTLASLRWYQAASASHEDYMMDPFHIHTTRVGVQAGTSTDVVSCKSLWPQKGCLKYSSLYSSADSSRRQSQKTSRPQ